MRPILLLTMTLGCATVDSSRTQGQPSAAMACALRMCAWGNGGACADLERSLLQSERLDVLMAQVRHAGDGSDAFALAVERCREGDSRRCDDATRALARAASGAWSQEPMVEALLEAVDREPKGNGQSTALSAR